tara:strand:- start:177 stop:1739 length:1563 start_codon:yes stop_codon:yes gene_type:complete
MKLTIEQALQQGVTAHKEGKLQDAAHLYRAILQSKPAHPDANHNLGVIAVSLNKTDAALPLFKTALEANPRIEQFWLSYIDALIKEQQFENAKQVIKQAKKQGVDANRLNSLKTHFSSKTKKTKLEINEPPQELLNQLLGHYKNTRFEDAEKLSIKITRDFPKHPTAWKVLGAVLSVTGRKSEAVDANQKAVALSPKNAEAHSNLGVALKEIGRLEEAEASYKQAIALKPDNAEAYSNLGNTLKELGRLVESVASYKQAIELKPGLTQAHYNLGNTLHQLGRLDEAVASYNQAVTLNPDYSSAKHMLHALTGVTTKTAPQDFVEGLFDSYAARFESSLIDELEYKTPKVIASMIKRDSKSDSVGSIADLGCGTGLFGTEIRQVCEHLEGVDLSEKMLEKAKEKSVYDKLVKQDIMDYLSNASLNFDYFVATDVFVYIGELSDIFRLIKSRNDKGGKLTFSTEDFDGKHFFLEQSGRYSHSKKYIESLCKKFGYELSHFEIQALRKDNNQYIRGGLYLLNF